GAWKRGPPMIDSVSREEGRKLADKTAELSQHPDEHHDQLSSFTWSGAWSIAEDAVIGAAKAIKKEATEHPWRFAGEVALGIATVTIAVVAAPEIAALSLAGATALGLSEGAATVASGLVTAAWLTLPYTRVASHLGTDTVEGIKNTEGA